jgi:hypothetical protein|tara:strand:+ start:134 stop:487 length:354 start_codon:yes stop_codon:yes gene_type:complete
MTDTFTQDHANATAQAVTAVTQFFNETLNGQDRPMCGFGWVAFYPANKGNTKLGKAERKLVESVGFRKDYDGKTWRMSNPGRYRGQNVDAQYAGAAAYAGRMSKETGMTFVAREALD